MFQNQYHFNHGYTKRPTWTNAWLCYYFFTDPHKYYCACWLESNSPTVNDYVNVLVFPVSCVCKMTSMCRFLLVIFVLLVLNMPNVSGWDSLGAARGSLLEIWHISNHFFFPSAVVGSGSSLSPLLGFLIRNISPSSAVYHDLFYMEIFHMLTRYNR